MNKIQINLNRKDNQRNVFRKQKRPLVRPLWRQGIESFLMFLGGILLLTFLNYIPKKFDWTEVIFESWTDLIQGIRQLFEALVGFGGIILVLVIVIIGLTLFLGGAFRLCRFISRLIINQRKASRQGFNKRKRR